MSDDHSCNMEEICIVLVKMFDGIVGESKEVMYVLQLKKNLISVDVLKALALEILVETLFSRCLKARWL